MPISREEVVSVYREVLKRDPESEDIINYQMALNDDVLCLLRNAMSSVEFTRRVLEHAPGAKLGEINGRVYEQIVTTASYAPWRSDTEFMTVYGKIAGHTLVDLHRCWNLWHLARQVSKHVSRVDHFVEIGVWRGGTGILMARGIASHGPERTIYLCDTFQGVIKAGESDAYYHGGEHADASPEIVRALAAALGVSPSKYQICEGRFPEDLPEPLRYGRFGFVHIDVDTYQSAKDCFTEIWPRMAEGGIVVFDDYGFMNTTGVAKLVDEESDCADGLCFYNLSGQAIFIKL
jgi:O-methyltransferase